MSEDRMKEGLVERYKELIEEINEYRNGLIYCLKYCMSVCFILGGNERRRIIWEMKCLLEELEKSKNIY